MQWIQRYSDAMSVLISAGMLVVWLVYLQVFIRSYRRSIRATLVIARGAGEGLAARCLLGNMSTGAIYVSSVQVRLDGNDAAITTAVTNLDGEGAAATRQGPLAEGASRDIGSFGDLVAQAFLAAGREPGPIRRMTIEVVGIYGSEDLPVGARRSFRIEGQGGSPSVRGEALWTHQIRSRRERRMLNNDLARDP